MIAVDFSHIEHKIHHDHEDAGPGEGTARAGHRPPALVTKFAPKPDSNRR